MARTSDKVAELEIEQDLRFTRVTWALQIAGLVLMVAIVLSGLAGLLGNGPMSSRDVSATSGDLSIHYDRFVHRLTPTQLVVTVEASGPAASVSLEQRYLDKMKVESVLPEPKSIKLDGERVVYEFETAPGRSRVLFDLEPQSAGRAEGSFALGGGGSVKLSQLIYP